MQGISISELFIVKSKIDFFGAKKFNISTLVPQETIKIWRA